MSLEADAALLASIPIFGLLEREAIKLLAFHAERQDFGTDELLINSGEKANGGLIVINGQISLESDPAVSDHPADTLPKKIVSSGALIGQLALITDVTHRVRARALEPTSVLEVKRSSFQRILREYPDCAAKIRAAIASDLLDFTKQLETSRL